MNLLPNFAEEIGLTPSRRRLQAVTLHRHRWFMLFVALPVALAALYYGLIASDQYVSQSCFMVKILEQRGAQVSTLAGVVRNTCLARGHLV